MKFSEARKRLKELANRQLKTENKKNINREVIMKILVLISALILSGCGIANPQSEITGSVESVNELYRSWDDNGEMVGSVIVLATEVKKVFVNDSPVEWNYTNIAGKQYVFISPVRIGDFYKIVRE